MNSYPHEFLAHPQPLMFVAGLTPSSRDRAASLASGSGQRSRAGSTATRLEASHGGPALTTPIASPSPLAHMSLPISPPATSPPIRNEDGSKTLDQVAGPSKSSSSIQLAVDAEEDEFELLVRNLRESLEGLGGKGKVWVKQSERRDFRIMLVDKHVRLPMRKINPSPAGSQVDISAPRSPLSPLTPTSPLYPDGLIAPIWVRKHAEMVPSVFVLFLRLYESTEEGEVEDILGGNEAQNAERRAKEQEMDEALVKEIGDRRRRLGERGIKLTVVLMASAAALDSPALDPRLSYLRRASALSSKASLFVLSPVPADQLPEFVQSLQDALFDSAAEYYSAHAKRVKRKRARVSTSSLAVPGAAGKVLGAQGWAVRYDWKSGWFAEIRGDLDEARRHYEDCWNELARMFSSTQTLPPRTKRWAEAKVLADCVAMRICRLLLYGDDSAKVLGPFFVHLKRFGDLSRGWGIGEETFEFWSWIARQYRIFAELLEAGVQSGLRIPILAPPVLPTAQSAAMPPTPEYWSTPISSTNPLQTLQSPAFYFYTAASCSVQRQKRFEEALALEEDALASESGAASGYVSAAPGFANEKKVDHSAVVVELFTKAYSLLKEQDMAQNRTALYVAYRIAESYCQSAQYDMAMRFFERISPTFQRDKWTPIVRQIRKLWYECAQHTGQVESAARLLVEMMCPDSGIEGEDRMALPEDLLSLMKTTAPASEEPIILDMGKDKPLLDVRAGFWQAEAPVSSSVSFQISIACPDDVQISDLAFSSAVIAFSDGRPDCTIEADSSSDGKVSLVDLGMIHHSEPQATSKARLQWSPGQVVVLQGTLLGDAEGDCEVSSVRLLLKQGVWDLQLGFDPTPLQEWMAGEVSYVPSGGISSSIRIITSPHLVDLKLDHLPPAFMGERIPVKVKITSRDERDLELVMSVFLHPGEEGEESSISLDANESTSLLKDLDLGLLKAGEALERTIHLKSSAIGTKVIDVSLQTTVVAADVSSSTDDPDSPSNMPARAEDFEATAVIPIMAPFGMSTRVTYSPTRMMDDGLVVDATISTIFTGNQVRGIEVGSLSLTQAGLENAELSANTLAIDPFVAQRWTEHTVYSTVTKYTLRPRQASASGPQGDIPANLAISWRSDDASEFIENILPLPPLVFPTQQSFLTAQLRTPKTVHLQHPFPVVITITNSHPTHSIPDTAVSVDISDAFVWMGNRVARLADIPPNSQREIRVECVPVSTTGWVDLPRIRVYEGVDDARRDVLLSGPGMGKGGVGRVFVQP